MHLAFIFDTDSAYALVSLALGVTMQAINMTSEGELQCL